MSTMNIQLHNVVTANPQLCTAIHKKLDCARYILAGDRLYKPSQINSFNHHAEVLQVLRDIGYFCITQRVKQILELPNAVLASEITLAVPIKSTINGVVAQYNTLIDVEGCQYGEFLQINKAVWMCTDQGFVQLNTELEEIVQILRGASA